MNKRELDSAIAQNIASNGYLISAPWRSSGKTMVTLGLSRLALRSNLSVQTFKKGPDYIDPLWLSIASGTGCYNLDPYIQAEDELISTFQLHSNADTLSLVEGTMGLHDGLRSDGYDSNAAIAKLLNVPVILVMDCRGMHRTLAALVNGILEFDPEVNFAGVVLNRIRSARHAGKVRTALTEYCDIKVLGEVPETDSLRIAEKQLGLKPAPEHTNTEQHIDRVADLVQAHCDISDLFRDLKPVVVNKNSVSLEFCTQTYAPEVVPQESIRIGLAKDEAFHFYYQDDLDAFHQRGIELIEVSPLCDELPQNLDGLIIGGGFPERYAELLADNYSFRAALLNAIENGLTVHAECAGLMYLCRSLMLHGNVFDMVGVLPAQVSMSSKPLGRGYVRLRRLEDNVEIAAHEFHHSSIEFDAPQSFSYAIERGYGMDGKSDGVQYRNVCASYSHFRHTRSSPWVDDFIQRVQANSRGTICNTRVKDEVTISQDL